MLQTSDARRGSRRALPGRRPRSTRRATSEAPPRCSRVADVVTRLSASTADHARHRGHIRRPPAAGAARRGHAADLGPRPRGALLDPRRPRRRRRACSTSSPAPARSASRRSAAAPPRATFVDSAPAAIRAVKANLAALGAAAEVVRADALRWLRAASAGGRQYDLVFLDPPYRRAGELGAPLSAALAPVLAEGALVVAEADRRAPLELSIPAHRRTPLRRHPDPHPCPLIPPSRTSPSAPGPTTRSPRGTSTSSPAPPRSSTS